MASGIPDLDDVEGEAQPAPRQSASGIPDLPDHPLAPESAPAPSPAPAAAAPATPAAPAAAPARGWVDSLLRKLTAASRGAKQVITLGHGDELAGGAAAALPFLDREAAGSGATLGERYTHARDFYRKADTTALKEEPGSYIAGSIGAGAVVPGTSLRALTAKGLVAGYGESTATNPNDATRDALKGGAAAATFGGVVPAVGRRIVPALEHIGEAMGYRFLRDTPGLVAARKIPQGIGRAAYDEGAILPGTTVDRAKRVLEGSMKERGTEVGASRAAMEAGGFQHADARQLAGDFYNRAKVAGGQTSAGSPLPTKLLAEAEDLLPGVSKIDAYLVRQGLRPGTPLFAQARTAMLARLTPGKPVTPQGRLGWTQGEAIKSDAMKLARPSYDKISRTLTPGDESKRAIGAIYRDAGEQAAAAQAPNIPGGADLLSRWQRAKAAFGPVKDAFVTAEEGANRAGARSWLGLTPIIVGAAGGAAHDHSLKGGLEGAIAAHLLKTRGASTASAFGFAGADAARRLAGPMALALPGMDIALAQAAARRSQR